MGLLHNLDDGKKREITEKDFDYFLEVLPPVATRFQWNNENWSFGFAEGDDYIYAFQKQGGKYYAQKTDLRNPYECGVSLASQLAGKGSLLKERSEATRTASWIPTWVRLGKQSPWIRQANDPPFNTECFQACGNDNELLDKFEQGNWCVGQAFWRGDLCVVQQKNAGDEWLVIKQDVVVDSVSFGNIIKQKGRDAAKDLLDRIQSASLERCRELDY
jgi:hypothetical protein